MSVPIKRTPTVDGRNPVPLGNHRNSIWLAFAGEANHSRVSERCGMGSRPSTAYKFLRVDSPFFPTIVCFKHQPFHQGVWWFPGKKDPWNEWGTQLFSDPGKKGTLLEKNIFSGAATTQKKGGKRVPLNSEGSTRKLVARVTHRRTAKSSGLQVCHHLLMAITRPEGERTGEPSDG